MTLKDKITISFLLAIAIILTQSIPTINSVPDFPTIILIIIILMIPSYKRALLWGVFLGILSSLMAKSPNSQIPNIICKIATVNISYILLNLLKTLKVKNYINIILFIGLFSNYSIYIVLSLVINDINFYNRTVILELSFLILLSSIINTKIGNMTLKFLKKCIYYDTFNNNNC